MSKWIFLLLVCGTSAKGQLSRYSFTEPKMGSYFTITLYASDSVFARKQATECFALVDSLNASYSDYIPGSELNLLSASSGKGQWVAVSPALLDILLASQRAWRLTGGAFDITVGRLVRLWRKARKANRFPAADSIRLMLKSTGFQHVSIDSAGGRVLLKRPGMQLDLGGIGQGYMAQKVLEHLAANGIRIALVDASGDIVLGDAPPGKRGWHIAVNVPESGERLLKRQIVAHNVAVITSGDVYQFMIHKGRKYSHIIDPGTGYGVTTMRNATVIAADGITADWLATTCTILPPGRLKKIAAAVHAEYLIGTLHDEQLIFFKSGNFEQFRKSAGE